MSVSDSQTIITAVKNIIYNIKHCCYVSYWDIDILIVTWTTWLLCFIWYLFSEPRTVDYWMQ